MSDEAMVPQAIEPGADLTRLDGYARCPHRPPCPPADRADRGAAHTVACHPEQGWSLLCNGVIVFDDLGGLLPDGRVVAPHRPTHVRVPIAA